MPTVRAPSTRTPRQIQIEYARLFGSLQKKLNGRLFQDPELTMAINAYNRVVSRGGIALPDEIYKAFNEVVRLSTNYVQANDAQDMVEKIFPKLEGYNALRWKKRLTGQVGDLVTVRVMQKTRRAASRELSRRMGENVERITQWSVEHYQAMQNQMNDAVRRSENTGKPVNMFEIAKRAIVEGTVPPNTKMRNRAKVIARDQTSKFNAALTRTRSREVGASFYLWLGINDNRLREEHKGYNQKYFDVQGYEVDKLGVRIPHGMNTGGKQPADDVQCRCTAIWQIVF